MKKRLFLYVALPLVLLRTILSLFIPIYAITLAGVDDRLMVMLGKHFSDIHWLGTYNQYTLVKGIGFPGFLALLKWLHIPYIAGTTLFYSLACVCIVAALKPLIRHTWLTIVLFVVLLFNPIMIDVHVIQRVYRNSLVPGQVLFLFAVYLGMFLRYRKPLKEILPWGILGCFMFPFFWVTREDSMWILPFLAVFVIIFSISMGLIPRPLGRKKLY